MEDDTVEQRCVMAVLAENLFVVTLHWLIYRSGHRRASLPIISLSPTNRFNLVAKISRGAATLQMCHPPSMCCTYIFPCLSLTILPPPSATCITRPAIRSHARRSHWCCFYSLSAIRRVSSSFERLRSSFLSSDPSRTVAQAGSRRPSPLSNKSRHLRQLFHAAINGHIILDMER